jgi:predicted ATPase
MPIERIKISNFKVFKNLDIELGKFNVLIGANASGKSSFIQIFDFLRNIANNGLDNAISMEGGVEYLRNINIGAEEPLSFAIKIVKPDTKKIKTKIKDKILFRKLCEINYKFSLKFKDKNSNNYQICDDILCFKYKYFANSQSQSDKEIAEIEVKLFVNNCVPEIKICKNKLGDFAGFDFKKDDILPEVYKQMEISEDKLILETPLADIIDPYFEKFIKEISIYNMNPALPAKSTSITGKSELEEDSSNLTLVLKKILNNKEKKRKFTNIIRDILPFIKEIQVEKFADKSLLLKLKEVYNKKDYIPASLISDGTISMTALVVALYFENKPLSIIEEPERNIHPSLISKLVEMFVDASSSKQIIITTHNPEMVKDVALNNLFLVHRQENGFSKITRPVEKEEVKLFLNNDMGIDELYIQNLLEV